jgi:hypothetical protein
MFSVFGENHKLPPISSNIKESEIRKWKRTEAIRKCYDKLFKKIKSSEPETYLSKIIRIIWKDRRNAPKMQVAYAISICEMILNPENNIVQISEETIKQVIIKNYVSF